MTRQITVIGATGIQGGSVIRALVKDPAYSLTAITRNSQSEAAKKLALQGVRIVEANLDDVTALQAAFSGTSVIFAATNFFEPFMKYDAAQATEIETRHGINIAKAAAVTPTLEHLVWSTLPNTDRISGGKFAIPHYVSKNRVNDFIKSDPVLLPKTTFLWVPVYASNMNYPFYPSVQFPLVGDATVNVGLFTRAIIEQSDKTLGGKFVYAMTDVMTAGEMLATWAEVHGVEAEYVQVDKETYYSLWPKWGKAMDRMHEYAEWAKEKSFSGEDVILTKEDLGIAGLKGTRAAYAEM
ncbi:nmrA-like family domain-containing protein [Trichoderma breve]|uniref:NmrA-like family domain-containing protein n=1 Tax=Trichoderma breve TaxID=2034170 RepID=A0A9W9B8R9_9HYPO|nr:nmrA-like family domain-containing protein [Trichoderma breve]KAJ4858032.1 nmrA-like family domain-containing protein [Trichoderma breve]